MQKTDSYDRVNRRLNLGLRLLGLWLVLVSYYFLSQALDYRGLVARLAEWQFLHFDRYWPTFTFALLTTLCTAPFVAILWLVIARQRRDGTPGRVRRHRELRLLVNRVTRLQNFFAGLSAGCAICVGIIAWQMAALPDDKYDPRSIVLGSPDAIAPADGRAVVTGWVDLSETAQFNENLLLVKRTLYLAPVRASARDKAPLRYFVEVRREDVAGKFNPIVFPEGDDRVHAWRFRVRNIAFSPYMNGVLRRHALPGEIANLYRYAGYEVDKDNYVLFRSNAPIKWRYQTLAGEFLIVATLTALVALLFARRRRRIRKMFQRVRRASRGAPAGQSGG